MESAKLIIEVTAGIIPGEPEESFTKRWAITSAEWENAEREDARVLGEAAELPEEERAEVAQHAMHRSLLLAFRAAEADEYARLLRNPSRFNWTRTDWVWT